MTLVDGVGCDAIDMRIRSRLASLSWQKHSRGLLA
jgi:hypothetical protein